MGNSGINTTSRAGQYRKIYFLSKSNSNHRKASCKLFNKLHFNCHKWVSLIPCHQTVRNVPLSHLLSNKVPKQQDSCSVGKALPGFLLLTIERAAGVAKPLSRWLTGTDQYCPTLGYDSAVFVEHCRVLLG